MLKKKSFLRDDFFLNGTLTSTMTDFQHLFIVISITVGLWQIVIKV